MDLIEDHQAIQAPAGVDTWDIDPYAPDVLAEPTEYYAQPAANTNRHVRCFQTMIGSCLRAGLVYRTLSSKNPGAHRALFSRLIHPSTRRRARS